MKAIAAELNEKYKRVRVMQMRKKIRQKPKKKLRKILRKIIREKISGKIRKMAPHYAALMQRLRNRKRFN